MSNTIDDPRNPLANENLNLVDTDMPVRTATLDHLGRREAATVGEAFRQDWPYIIGLVLLMTFVIAALGGNFR